MALTDTFVKNVKHKDSTPAGKKYADGRAMYLLVNAVGKYWRMNYRFADKRKTLALGVYPDVGLAKARQRREIAREQLADGIDPSAAKREERQLLNDAAANTFEVIARDWLVKTAAKRKEVTQVRTTNMLEVDVFPFIGGMPITQIKARDVLEKSLRKIEARGSLDTAHRAKQTCGQIFRYAVAIGLAERDVTVDLRDALTTIPESHFSAITKPIRAGELMRSIFGYGGHPSTVEALKLTALVFVRPGELRQAEWAELDLEAAGWLIPGHKMKLGIEHFVPLSTQSIAVFRRMQAISGHGRYVFPSLRTGERPMSENTVTAALRGMGYSKDEHCAHGFRAMARTIMDEVMGERVDLIEHQLSHQVKDANGRAYNRTTHLPARQEMMQRWADYLDKIRIGADAISLKSA